MRAAVILGLMSLLVACGSTGVERPRDTSEPKDTVHTDDVWDTSDGQDTADPCAGVLCDSDELCQAGACLSINGDADNDSFNADVDCNDLDPEINPDAEEICDGLDNNCNGLRDEGYDGDGDNYADCGSINRDCDDTNPDVHPFAIELCDGLDNNCDGFKDEGFDADNDSYSACTSDPLQQDCNDLDPNVHPGAEELCNRNDDNCNGQTDEGTVCVGCSDGARDALTDTARWPEVAGCAGTFPRGSLRATRTNTNCGDDAGGQCPVPEDLCATGWHLCMRNGLGSDLAYRLTAADCSGVSGSYVAASDNCSNPTDTMPTTCDMATPLPCRPSGWCTAPVVCGGGEHTRCPHAVWMNNTHSFGTHSGNTNNNGCSNFGTDVTYSSDLTGGTIAYTGVLCCLD